jgi:molybdopterin-guanine dinucleotide biosynthesis protein A
VARPDLTGVLLVGGASSRFGSPKALARLAGETLAERAWRVLGETCGERFAVGKLADPLQLPFPIEDDGVEIRAPLAGVVAGLRRAGNDLSIILPVDCPRVTPRVLVELAEACAGDAAVPTSGPLPGAYRRSALPVLERRLESADLSLHGALGSLDATFVEVDPELLVNVNTPGDLRDLG